MRQRGERGKREERESGRGSGRGNDTYKREEKRWSDGEGEHKEGNDVQLIRTDRRNEGRRKRDNECMEGQDYDVQRLERLSQH